MDEFMLIFRHEDGQKIASPEQMQVWMKHWNTPHRRT